MKTLVTGAAGFIGSHLSERLISQGHSVVAVDAVTDYYDEAVKRANLSAIADKDLEVVEGDLNRIDLAPLLDGIDVVYHLAGEPGVRASWSNFDLYLERNVLATQRLLEGVRAAGVERTVYASSSSVYGDAELFPTSEDDLPAPISPYGVTKLAGEHLVRLYCRDFGVETVALRYFTVFGPRQRPDMAFCRFIKAALRERPLTVFGDGEQIRDFTYVGDVVTATISAASAGRPGAVYNIAGGAQASIREVLEIIGDLTGRPIAIDRRDAVAGDARRTGADISRARTEIGYAPQVSLDEGLERQVAAARSQE